MRLPFRNNKNADPDWVDSPHSWERVKNPESRARSETIRARLVISVLVLSLPIAVVSCAVAVFAATSGDEPVVSEASDDTPPKSDEAVNVVRSWLSESGLRTAYIRAVSVEDSEMICETVPSSVEGGSDSFIMCEKHWLVVEFDSLDTSDGSSTRVKSIVVVLIDPTDGSVVGLPYFQRGTGLLDELPLRTGWEAGGGGSIGLERWVGRDAGPSDVNLRADRFLSAWSNNSVPRLNDLAGNENSVVAFAEMFGETWKYVQGSAAVEGFYPLEGNAMRGQVVFKIAHVDTPDCDEYLADGSMPSSVVATTADADDGVANIERVDCPGIRTIVELTFASDSPPWTVGNPGVYGSWLG